MTTWNLKNTKRLSENGFIIETTIMLTATSDEYEQINCVNTFFNNYVFVEGKDFIPFDNLIEDDVIKWFFDTIDKTNLEKNIESLLLEKIDNFKNPTVINGNPKK